MATEPVELDAKLLARVRDTTDDPRGYVESAVRRQLDDQAFSRLLDELEAVGNGRRAAMDPGTVVVDY